MDDIRRHIAAVRKRLRQLDLGRRPACVDAEREYFRYYGLDIPGVDHFFGLLRHEGAALATHVFVPKKHRAAAVLVHGYLEHGAYFRHAVKRLLKERYAVVLFDLPGHGLSSGSPATIRDFSAYARALEHVVRFAARKFGAPVHLVGHSMGCSAIVELLLTRRLRSVGSVVLVAPLVHSSMWWATKLAYPVLAPVVKKVPRMFPALSHDKNFMRFTLTRDPLLHKEIPLHWVHSMLRWNKRLEKYPASLKEIAVIQGTDDHIVDGEYNVACLKKKFPAARLSLIRNAHHQLFNESSAYRTKTLNGVVQRLGAGLAARRKR